MKGDNATTIFKCLVGSRAHGLDTPESDNDFRGVFIVPTREIVGLGTSIKTTNWIEGKVDDTSWEIGHFLKLATKCNPTILETFISPLTYVNEEYKETVDEMRDLFPAIWNSQYVHDAFVGYAHNQRKKLFEKKFGRPHKYAAAYLRVLYNAAELLETGTFTVRIGDLPIGQFIFDVKNKDPSISLGDIINKCEELERAVDRAYAKRPDKKTDIELVNNFLIKVRQQNF